MESCGERRVWEEDGVGGGSRGFYGEVRRESWSLTNRSEVDFCRPAPLSSKQLSDISSHLSFELETLDSTSSTRLHHHLQMIWGEVFQVCMVLWMVRA
jgi:hypothetical protein